MAYRAVNWTPNEAIGERKTDQMAENVDWLFRNTPRSIYTLPGGLSRTEGVKVAAGRVIIARKPKGDSADATVRFGEFFSDMCQPLVTTGIVSKHQVKIFCTLSGIGQLQPDNRGFQVAVNIDADKKKKDRILETFYVTWQAVGY